MDFCLSIVFGHNRKPRFHCKKFALFCKDCSLVKPNFATFSLISDEKFLKSFPYNSKTKEIFKFSFHHWICLERLGDCYPNHILLSLIVTEIPRNTSNLGYPVYLSRFLRVWIYEEFGRFCRDYDSCNSGRKAVKVTESLISADDYIKCLF